MTNFLLGVLASALVGLVFYILSVRSLLVEAEKLRTLVNILGRGLESNGLAKFNWDEKGNLKGVVHFLKTSAAVHSHTSDNVKLEVEENPPLQGKLPLNGELTAKKISGNEHE